MPAVVAPLSQPARGDGWVTETHWATVLDAGRGDDSQRAHAGLAQLCATYWPPVYSYLRRQGHRPDDAKDLTQEFFCRLIDRQYLKSLVPEKGKFRYFLLLLLNRFLADERDRANCQKRGGGRPIASGDARALELSYRREPLDDRTPEKIFERQWVLTLLQQVLDRLAAEAVEDGTERFFASVRHFLEGDRGDSYAKVASRLRMSEGAARVAVHRLRVRYREILYAEIARTVMSPDQIEDEMRHLVRLLS